MILLSEVFAQKVLLRFKVRANTGEWILLEKLSRFVVGAFRLRDFTIPLSNRQLPGDLENGAI